MFWRRRDGAEVTERLAALEVRLARLASEVHEAVGKVEIWGAREVARQAAFEEATDKLYRTAERARKLAGRRDGDAGESADASADDDAFWQVWNRRPGVVAGG